MLGWVSGGADLRPPCALLLESSRQLRVVLRRRCGRALAADHAACSGACPLRFARATFHGLVLKPPPLLTCGVVLPAVQDGLFAREFTRFQAHALAKVGLKPWRLSLYARTTI